MGALEPRAMLSPAAEDRLDRLEVECSALRALADLAELLTDAGITGRWRLAGLICDALERYEDRPWASLCLPRETPQRAAEGLLEALARSPNFPRSHHRIAALLAATAER